MAIKYFKSFLGILQHLIAVVLVVLLMISLVPGYYFEFNSYFVILIVFQMVLSFANLRLVNIFLELIFLVLSLLGFIPFAGWVFRFIALPVALLDMVSFKQGVVFERVEFFTKEGVKSRYEGFRDKRRDRRKKKNKRGGDGKVIDAEFKEK